MKIILDPEHNESNALFSIPIEWTEKSVLEIGSGDGRLTWRYADKVARVIGLEPDVEKHTAGLGNRPSGFEHVEFLNLGLDDFYEHVTLPAPVPQAQVSEAKSLKHMAKETLQSPDGSLRVTRDEKFDLVLLSWSL